MIREGGVALLLATVGMASASLAQTSGSIEVFDMLAPKERRLVTPDWKAINANPLGTRGNPVRVYLPAGEQGYLLRLLCADGSSPGFRCTGNLGAGPYGTILDDYDVACGATHYHIVMDMYHPGYLETRVVPGLFLQGTAADIGSMDQIMEDR